MTFNYCELISIDIKPTVADYGLVVVYIAVVQVSMPMEDLSEFECNCHKGFYRGRPMA